MCLLLCTLWPLAPIFSALQTHFTLTGFTDSFYMLVSHTLMSLVQFQLVSTFLPLIVWPWTPGTFPIFTCPPGVFYSSVHGRSNFTIILRDLWHCFWLPVPFCFHHWDLCIHLRFPESTIFPPPARPLPKTGSSSPPAGGPQASSLLYKPPCQWSLRVCSWHSSQRMPSGGSH